VGTVVQAAEEAPVGRIVITTNMSLDGVVQDPDGGEGFERGGWFTTSGGDDLAAWAELETAEALGASAMLLGRASDAWFAARWTTRPGAWADRLNALPKYVVSSTLGAPAWTNATVLRGDLVDEVRGVKAAHDGEILVYASYQLVRALLEHGLADELRLVVFPVVLGGGARLFGDTVDPTRLRLLEARPLGSDLAFLSYAVVPAEAPGRDG
jgi:dihydrofolate reductase